jgi:ribosomal protein L11 methyltransferase
MALAPLLAAQVRPGGMIALAGLLDSQAAQIAEVYAPGCELMTVRTLDGWALLAGMRVH